MSGFNDDIRDIYRAMNSRLQEMEVQFNGTARQAMWGCEDGWIVAYSTERVKYGPYDGKFVAMLYKPVGPGSKSGKANEWRRTYIRGFSQRKLARKRAEVMFYQHSPERALKEWVKGGEANAEKLQSREA